MIYLDHNATTPLAPAARAAMQAWLGGPAGNPSSSHACGRAARAALEEARRRIAAAVGVEPSEVVFTSGGTEGNNLALFGAVPEPGGAHLVVSPIEHASVLAPVRELERRGARVTWLPVDGFGRVRVEDVAAALTPETVLVSVGWANNEIGTIQPIAAITELCRDRGVRLHVDAVQALGKVAVDARLPDLCVLSAHKLGGPVGIGALIVRRGAALGPLSFGGEQERGRRPGTENVPGAVGFAAALAAQPALTAAVEALRERLWRGVSAAGGVERHSLGENCLPNTLNVGFAGVRGETLVAALDLEGVAVSVGSACAAGSGEPSHVLRAVGREDAAARAAVRFSLGVGTTAEEVDAAIDAVRRVIARHSHPPSCPSPTRGEGTHGRSLVAQHVPLRPARRGERVVVAMSGGVDSSVAAALLVEAGYDVAGVAMRLWDGGESGCCSLDDFLDARRVADRLRIPFYVMDFRPEFAAAVVDDFVAEYRRGRTPNPCARCNQLVKFAALWDRARELGAERLATGHYARAVSGKDGPELLRGADGEKDQSYFLFAVGRDVLGRTLFPVGAMSKTAVRAVAERLGLAVARKPDSQEVCFAARRGCAAFVAGRPSAEPLRPGVLVDKRGRVLAQHDGVHRFTVGQRHGLGVACGAPLYVTDIDPEGGVVRVGDAGDVVAAGFAAAAPNWLAPIPSAGARLYVKIRSRFAPHAARVLWADRSGFAVAADDGLRAVTPGQAAVLYDGERVIGGGWIVRALRDVAGEVERRQEAPADWVAVR